MIWRRALVFGLVLVTGGDVARVVHAPLAYSRSLRDPEILSSNWLSNWMELRSFDPDTRAFVIDLQLTALRQAINVKTQIRPEGDARVVALVSKTAGSDRNYLLKIAQRESGMNPWARANRSSAAGLFQFTENTWLCMVLDSGSRAGIKVPVDLSRTDNGRCRTSDDRERSRLLALRYDPILSTRLAGAFTSINDDQFVDAFGRRPDDDERYVLHVFGAGSGTRLLRSAVSNPDLVAASIFPVAARANPTIFYDRNGRPRTVAEVVERLEL